jgi:di-N-acetylchitobiase
MAPPRQEILAFSTQRDKWPHYDWTKVTTVAIFYPVNASNATEIGELYELVCYAHSKGARVVLSGNFPVANLSNETQQNSWIKERLEEATEWFLDGINIDIEEPINDSTVRDALTQFVIDVKVAFSSEIPGSQVTFDVAWSPNCIDGRCYDAAGLAYSVDFLIVMSYDERSQIYGNQCIASANSPLGKTIRGIEQYLELGIPRNKIVLGQPWYGYDYPCLNVSEDLICSINKIPFRGAPCSDAAGQEDGYGNIQQLLLNSTTGRIWNKTLSAPFFDYKATDGVVHQVWYDDPESLGLKYDYALANGLRGIAMWTSDSLDYSNNTNATAQTKAMWNALPTCLSAERARASCI